MLQFPKKHSKKKRRIRTFFSIIFQRITIFSAEGMNVFASQRCIKPEQ